VVFHQNRRVDSSGGVMAGKNKAMSQFIMAILGNYINSTTKYLFILNFSFVWHPLRIWIRQFQSTNSGAIPWFYDIWGVPPKDQVHLIMDKIRQA
jgi:hypothetical protein